MNANEMNASGNDHADDLSFELREMLGMLDRLAGDISEAATNDYGDDEFGLGL